MSLACRVVCAFGAGKTVPSFSHNIIHPYLRCRLFIVSGESVERRYNKENNSIVDIMDANQQNEDKFLGYPVPANTVFPVNIVRRETLLGEKFVDIEPLKTRDSLDTTDSTLGPSVAVSALNHVSYNTHNLPAMLAFYQHLLGFTSLPRPNFMFSGAWLQAPGGMTLHLIEAEGDPVPLRDPAEEERAIRRGKHLAFSVQDTEATEQVLQEWGLRYTKFMVPGNGQQQIFLYDPDGNGVELINVN
mmetsp:Transcript_24102/g.33171  ORF Transcript_24102/g.33171 Transcript_24102/m.33171 type:complete len:245 (+) Transcript_24102:165-899(+)